MDLELGTFSLREALENGLTMVRERASDHSLRLNLDVDPAIGLIEADERKVKQVIFNLLSNAVKFTPDRGRVDVVARLVDDCAEISVRDTGVGIAPEDHTRIFEEFQQAPSGQAVGREGTGLGLALARRFVELHGGQLWVDSQVGVGSTFTFMLPLRPATAATTPESQSANHGLLSPIRGSGQAVLVVEDNPQARDLLQLYLENDGFEVVAAEDGETALLRARELHPRVIVLDILLPRLDGWDVLTRAKADPTLAHIPIVVVSMLDERGKGFALGAADYLIKPVQCEALLTTLRRLTFASNGANGRPSVLAIDDDPLALELIDAVLSPAGYQVLKAADGHHGVTAAKIEHPGLVIVDLLMPEMDGFAVVEQLRADPTTSGIPIVILTSRSMDTADRERLNGQISHLARKGAFDRGEFVELVRKLCPLPAAIGSSTGR